MFPADFVVDYVRVYKDQAGLTVNELQYNAINVYPNPTDGLLTIEGLTEETSLNYTIYSIDGDLLEQNSMDFSKTIDINQLASGMYVLQLNFPDGFSKRISITKK